METLTVDKQFLMQVLERATQAVQGIDEIKKKTFQFNKRLEDLEKRKDVEINMASFNFDILFDDITADSPEVKQRIRFFNDDLIKCFQKHRVNGLRGEYLKK